MVIRYVVTILGLLLLIGALAGLKVTQFQAMAEAGKTMKPPAEVVSSTLIKREQWEQTLRSVGTLEAVRGVTVTADFSGRVDEILFTSGSEVQKGALLLQQNIDAEKAQLRAAEASLALAKANLMRSKELLAKSVVSQSQYDASDAEYKSAQAQVENLQVTMAKKSVKAPFSGRLGIRKVNLGQDIQKGEAIVTLQTTNPLLVNFNLPQQNLKDLQLGLEVRIKTDAVPDRIYTGTVTAINPEVNTHSRNVLVQAKLNNDDEKLLPGMFAVVTVAMPEQRSVLSIPLTAVRYATFGDSVFVLEESEDDNGEKTLKATQQFVQLGEARGDFIEVLEGVQEGDVVATAGLFKLRNGAPVAVNNAVVPTFERDPTPANR
ncbi:efflux RND transporter periplasmic adaptor subunit [Marinagarivorans algicola]|uniref:efflux RND transporter periplasmic adaptor subunit n=1 Tax=Marinagarivorans algicola TaxID=1513270 RepID=UPI0006B4B9D0|nr:efflux RND transporter periplasmic adaptor subunit [Marinagarivorans algicola]